MINIFIIIIIELDERISDLTDKLPLRKDEFDLKT